MSAQIRRRGKVPAALRRKMHQGAAMIELSIYLFLVMVMLGASLQLGRALHSYHVLTTAVHSAALYLATAPDAELKASGQANARALIQKMAEEGGMVVAPIPVTVTFNCLPAGSAPCGGSTLPTKITVRAVYTLSDAILPNFSWYLDMDVSNIPLLSQVTVPRIGYW